jgi:penicillin V acylase-like amidase (Ntn superfamily)
MFCRNYDFPYTPAMQLFTSPKNGFRSVSTVELDFLGYSKDSFPSGLNFKSVIALGAPYLPWDGMNEKGLAIALLAVPEAEGPGDDSKLTLGTTTIIRLVLDKASTVDEAVELMRQYNIYFSAGICCHFLLADASGKSVLVEYWEGELVTVAIPEDYQVASNFIAYDGLNIGEGFNEMERYIAVKNRIEENGGCLSWQQAVDLLCEVGIYYEGTDKLQWTVIYNLSTLKGSIFARRNTGNIIDFELNP